MAWSMVLLALVEVASMEATTITAKLERKKDSDGDELRKLKNDTATPIEPTNELKEEIFAKLWKNHADWAGQALVDAVKFAQANQPRISDTATTELIRKEFFTHLWPALEGGRQWKEDEDDDEVFLYQTEKFSSPSKVMSAVPRLHPELTNIVIPMLVRIDESKTKSIQIETQKKAKELALSASTVNLQSLQDFLDRYGPLQILHDRNRTHKIGLGKRLLSSCYHIEAASTLVKAASDESLSGKANDDKLLNLVALGGRSTLPHPMWTSRHDVILLHAIVKHGWIGVDESSKNVIGDRDIKWGFPFEPTKKAPIQRMGVDEFANLRSTAERAALVLRHNTEVLKVMTGFNKKLVIDSYGLSYHEAEDCHSNEESRTWRVDQDLLHQASKKSEPSQEAIDLPSKKDLVKRAKVVISKGAARMKSRTALGETGKSLVDNDHEEVESHGYAVIDQSNSCYVLLAELVRAVLKGSNKSTVQMKTIWNLVRDETIALTEMFSAQDGKQNEVDDLKAILGQIKLAKKSCYSNMTQGKNVLRVMIGEKPSPPRNQVESMFPVSAVEENGGREKTIASERRETTKNDPSLGERALAKAIKKAQDKQGGGPLAFSPKVVESLGLQLTMIEVYILSAFILQPMPFVPPGTKENGLSNAPAWEGVLDTLHAMAKEQLQNAVDALKVCKAALDKARKEGFGPEAVATLASKVAKAESCYSMRDEAGSTVADYLLNHPTSALAKKR
jgi:hypothetical protein